MTNPDVDTPPGVTKARQVNRRLAFFEPEVTKDGRATVYVWHTKVIDEPERGVRATHMYIDVEANVFLLDRNAGDAIMYFAPRDKITFVQRFGAVTAPAEGPDENDQ